MMSEYIGVISHADFITSRDAFEKKIQHDAVQAMNDLGYVVKDCITEWIKKPSFLGEPQWACCVTFIVVDQLEEQLRG